MKLSLPPLLLGLCVALAVGGPAQAKAEPRKASLHKAAAVSKSKFAGTRSIQVRRVAAVAAIAAVAEAPARASFGQMQGLHAGVDALALKSSVALVIDQDTNEVLFSKNPAAVLLAAKRFCGIHKSVKYCKLK